jgi:hypothetical protein
MERADRMAGYIQHCTFYGNGPHNSVLLRPQQEVAWAHETSAPLQQLSSTLMHHCHSKAIQSNA